jgi:hypothetical protein
VRLLDKITAVCAVTGCLLGSPAGFAQPGLHDEQHVKAAVVLQMAHFIEWPPETAASPTFDVCLAARDSWIDLFTQAARGQTVGGKPVRISRLSRPEDASGCRIIFVGTGLAANLRAAIEETSALTVSDEQGFTARGGMVELAVQSGRVVFALATVNALPKGIRFSSKLIRLARGVQREVRQ